MEAAADHQTMVSSFLEIAVGQTADTARRFLQATSWKLEEALQLFYIEADGGSLADLAPTLAAANDPDLIRSDLDKDWGGQDGAQDVRAPLPVKRDVLYDNMVPYRGARPGSQYGTPSVIPFRNFDDETKRSGGWEGEQGSSSSMATNAQDNLASLYCPPFALMYHGPFEKAKDYARAQNKWLLINMQSNGEFTSHMLNRDTWANEAVAQTIKANFIFWQVYDDTEEGSKVCTYYKLDKTPAVLLLDPITGQKLRTWCGMVQPQTLLEDLVPYMDGSPSENHFSLSHKRPREGSQASGLRPHHAPDNNNSEEDDELQRALAASLEKFDGGHTGDLKVDGDDNPDKGAAYLPLPKEPKVDRNLLCRIGVRLPDGRRVQRNFLRRDPIQLLWSFCFSELKEGGQRPFSLTQAIPGASKKLDYNVKSSFGESGLDNSMVSVTWES